MFTAAKHKSPWTLRLAPCASVLVALTAMEVHAAVIVNSGGFETSAGYTTTFGGDGRLEGQVPGVERGTWQRTEGPALGTAKVQTAVVKSGSQAVQIDRASNSDDRWAIPVDGFPSAGNFLVQIEWDMLVHGPAGDAADDFGPLFGVEAYSDDGTSIGLLGSLLVDATTGDVLYQEQGSGELRETGALVDFDAWYSFDLLLDYRRKSYRVYVDDVLLHTEGFVDENLVSGGLTRFTDADLAALSGGPDSDGLEGTAYVDNFIVRESIPEPCTLALVGLGIATQYVIRSARGTRGERASTVLL